MAQVLTLPAPYRTHRRPSSTSPSPLSRPTLYPTGDSLQLQRHSNNPGWATLQEQLKCQGRHTCLFSDGRKKEEARKALESALGGKKFEFEKWNKEIEKREKMGGGGTSGGGGWFGGGCWFGWFEGEHFWEEAQQACLVIIGIVFLYLLITKGNVMFAIVFNSLLFVLRGTRNWLTFMSSQLSGRISPSMPVPDQTVNKVPPTRISAKESVIRKWGMD